MRLKIVSWNVCGIGSVLEHLPTDTDIACLQETQPSLEYPRIANGPGPTAIVPVSLRASVEPVALEPVPEAAAKRGAHPTSYPGTISVSLVTNPKTGAQLYVASTYVKWEKAGTGWIVPDASAHRLISDISSLIATENHKIPIVVAGDWNIFFQHGETPYWLGRYNSVFERMQALGFELIGPFCSENGLHRDAPHGLMQPPATSTPTYHTTHENPSVAWRQLDFVFASRSIAAEVTATALNREDEWGPSDHCRIVIEVPL